MSRCLRARTGIRGRINRKRTTLLSNIVGTPQRKDNRYGMGLSFIAGAFESGLGDRHENTARLPNWSIVVMVAAMIINFVSSLAVKSHRSARPMRYGPASARWRDDRESCCSGGLHPTHRKRRPYSCRDRRLKLSTSAACGRWRFEDLFCPSTLTFGRIFR